MDHTVIVYGLAEEKISLLQAALPEGYSVAAAECVTELIITNAVCSIVDAQAPDKQAMNTLLAYYMDVGDRLDETVVWLGNRSYINTLYIASTRWGKNATSGVVIWCQT